LLVSLVSLVSPFLSGLYSRHPDAVPGPPVGRAQWHRVSMQIQGPCPRATSCFSGIIEVLARYRTVRSRDKSGLHSRTVPVFAAMGSLSCLIVFSFVFLDRRLCGVDTGIISTPCKELPLAAIVTTTYVSHIMGIAPKNVCRESNQSSIAERLRSTDFVPRTYTRRKKKSSEDKAVWYEDNTLVCT
jgi:hypothetical protein